MAVDESGNSGAHGAPLELTEGAPSSFETRKFGSGTLPLTVDAETEMVPASISEPELRDHVSASREEALQAEGDEVNPEFGRSIGVPRRGTTVGLEGPDGLEDPEAPRVWRRRLPESTKAQRRRRAATIVRVVRHRFGSTLLEQAKKRGAAARAGDVAELSKLRPGEWAGPLRETFEDLGTTFMKFGQMIGSSPGIFGDEVAQEFRSCLDTGPEVNFDDIKVLIEDELGMALDDAYASFDSKPLGSASIAVAYRAQLHDGTDVAVKVLRPRVEYRVSMDLDLLQPLLEAVVRATGEQAAVSMLQQFDGFRLQLGEELDLRNEARMMSHYRDLLDVIHMPLVTVPRPFPELSTSRLLTMEFIDGVPVDDLGEIERRGLDPKPVVQQVVKAFFLTAIRWGTFHGDVHAGNLLLTRDGRIGVIDWGIVGRLDPETHFLFRRMIGAALGDESAWPDIAGQIKKGYGDAIEAGLGFDDEQLTMFVRSMMEPILNEPFGQVSLGEMLMAPQREVAKAQGIEAGDRSLWTLLKRIRNQRKLRSIVESSGVVASDWDRSTFLLSKQLMYFERYGKMYMADVSLFEDREFFEAALAMPSVFVDPRSGIQVAENHASAGARKVPPLSER